MSDENKSGSVIAQKQYQETMPKLELELNSRVLVNLSPMSSEKPARLQGEFLGASHYEFLILRLPSIPGLINKLFPHMRLEVSYQFKGAVNKFFAEMISYTTKPSLMIFTSYPDRMSVMEVRKHQRITCALPVTLATSYGDGIAAIKDLSKGGCRLVVELTGQSSMRQLTEGDRVVVQGCFSPDGNSVRGIAIVRAVEISGSRMSVGLAFDEAQKDFGKALGGYLDLIQVLE
jgi:hypothetical protein